MDDDVKKYNKIPYRISVIEDMTKDRIIDNMIGSGQTDITENITSTQNTDIRTLL